MSVTALYIIILKFQYFQLLLLNNISKKYDTKNIINHLNLLISNFSSQNFPDNPLLRHKRNLWRNLLHN